MKESNAFPSVLLFYSCLAFAVPPAVAQPEPTLPRLVLQPYADGFGDITDIASAGDVRLFVVEQGGLIKIIDGSGIVLADPFLDISSLVTTDGNEQGLLGLVFHPDFETNGYFYVNYTAAVPEGETHISRFSVSATDPNMADASSEMIILTQAQPFSNHNAGDLNFGPDGYLYIPLGDGGSAFDPMENAQDPGTLLGKMLRIDVDSGSPYAIPPTNPYVNDPAVLDEIWAFGLRNPWRFSFDRVTGDMWIGDVGQNIWEEVDFEPAGGPGGSNWGWDCYEGEMLLEPEGCGPASQYDMPVFTYHNPTHGCAIQGGYVYRGEDYPVMQGHYIFTDFCSGNFWTLYPDGSGGFNVTEQLQFEPFNYTTFGEDNEGELYVGGRGGTVYRVIDAACQKNKIMVCHQQGNNNSTICVAFDQEAIADHVAHGDQLGPCNTADTRMFMDRGSSVNDLSVVPNPFTERTMISFTTPAKEFVAVELIDAAGRLIENIYRGTTVSGVPTQIEFNSDRLNSGIYVVRLTTGERIHHERILVLDN